MDAYSVRIRQESKSRDMINSRAWDFFHATPATLVSADGLRGKKGSVHMDMNPICSRTNAVSYRNQPQYIPDPVRTTGSVAAPSFSVPPTSFSQNPYLQRLNASGQDGRNMLRELRGAVVEDNLERTVDAERMLATRQFRDRWLPTSASAEYGSIYADELLRANMRHELR